MTLGEKIRKYRILNNMTMKELSEELGMSIGAIQKYENGSVVPKTDIIQKISKILNVSIETLLEESSQKNDKETIIIEKIIELTKYDQLKWIKCDNEDVYSRYKLYEEDFLKISKIINDSLGYSSKNQIDKENEIKELSNKIIKNGFITNVKDTLYILYDEGYLNYKTNKKIYELKAFQDNYGYNLLVEFSNNELLTKLFNLVNEKANIDDGNINEILSDLDNDINNLIDELYGF